MSQWHDMMPKFILGTNFVMNVTRESLKAENLLRIGHCWSDLSQAGSSMFGHGREPLIVGLGRARSGEHVGGLRN